ncbi:hypothetical protein [Microbacter margulisiae]|uniref:DUF4345 domain-containing protein n=1 Tax=Microbacter margulisiae TaxID=1350067 RepID=A0A7W5DRA0_9PORP|nr:hypothetical protein [Microbacter margulisiae]MBB3187647.1 hypothetical protein [Microbacter margulisiae]
MTKKLTTVHYIKGLLLFRFIMIIVMLIIVYIVLMKHPEKGFLTGFADPILERVNIKDNPENTFAYIIGQYSISMMIILLEYIFLVKKKKIGFWIVFGIDFVVTLGQHAPWVSIIIFILAISKETRLYFKQQKVAETINNMADSELTAKDEDGEINNF